MHHWQHLDKYLIMILDAKGVLIMERLKTNMFSILFNSCDVERDKEERKRKKVFRKTTVLQSKEIGEVEQ